MKVKRENEKLFSSVSISYFVHSTEDEALIAMAVCSSLGVEPAELQRQILQGYYGNEIDSITSHIIGSHAEEVARRVFLGMDSSSKAALNADLEAHIDEHDSLFVRIDKDSLIRSQGGNPSLAIGEEEAIRIKLKPKHRRPLKEEMITFYRRLLENET
jgi:RNA binding exosome subunit